MYCGSLSRYVIAMAAAQQRTSTELGNRLELTSQNTGSDAQFVCPDPSAHAKGHHSHLQEQSASAALKAASGRSANEQRINPLGPDGKLSSAGAATSLKYARAQDLPSYPSVGIDTKNSGLGAASLAFANPKDVQYPKVESNSQNSLKAATLANNYKMAPLWQPEASAAGSKAALLAAQGKGRDWWQPSASKDGLQAATLATRNKNLGPEIYQGNTPDGKNKALMAATLSVKGRKRSDSTPEPASYPDAANAKSNSLKAATSVSSRANEQSRIIHARNLSREMYTEHPDVDIEKKERAHQDALKGASISMAKKMYALERVDDQGHVQLSAGRAAAQTADRSSVGGEKDLRQQALQYLTLQDAAQRLAAERLAKIDNQQEQEAFRDYYGYSSKRRSRLTLKGRNRRRASSEGATGFRRNQASVESPPASPQPDVPHKRGNLDIDSDDEEQAAKVRSQMSTFNAKLAEADKKRTKDQQNLLAAAERKVQAQMHKMDEKVFNETGKMSPAMMEDWDSKARAKAAAASQARMQNHGKVDIGGGKFMDQSEIDAIAMGNVRPTLDEIHETAEKQRARDEEIRLEKEQQRREAQQEKERNADNKALAKKMKADDKEAEKARKREAKIAADHEKSAAKEEKQRAKEAAREEKQREQETSHEHAGAVVESSRQQEQKGKDTTKESQPMSPKEKKSPWKKLIPGGHRSEREPGSISRYDAKHDSKKDAKPVPQDGYTAAMANPATPRTTTETDRGTSTSKSSVEITPTGATMAGDGPSSIGAPDRDPETEAAIDQVATTPSGERSDPIGESSSSRKVTSEDTENTPASPSKKRFSRIMGKLKRNKRDEKKESSDAAETSSFTGGAKLHKQRQDESRTASGTTESSSAPVAAGGVGSSSAAERRASSPSISSLSESDDEQEQRGRSATRLDRVASHVMDIKDSDSDGEGDFEEARDRFDGELAPPSNILSKKHAESPVRDSKFVENI